MLTTALYTPEQVRELDQIAITEAGIPGLRLMERAGRRAFAVLRSNWPQARRITIFCGGGNNAGDGYVVGRLAHEAGLEVEVIYLSDPHRLKGDAATQAQRFLETSAACKPFDAHQLDSGDVIVDALLGTGLDRPVAGEYAAAVEAINGQKGPVLALDIPSGLHARTGSELGCAVQAHATVTFVGLKSGLFTARGPALCGTLFFDDLGTAAVNANRLEPYARLVSPDDLTTALTPRPRDAHKGDCGHVLIIGGGPGMAGAARLAGEAALRCGAGLVSVATRTEHISALVGARPELMVHGVESANQIAALLERCTTIVVGPGLGQDSWADELWHAAMASPISKVIDADGLNILANQGVAADNAVLTPHPGEAARLLGQSTAQISADRFAAARALALSTAAKGTGTSGTSKGAGTIATAIATAEDNGAAKGTGTVAAPKGTGTVAVLKGPGTIIDDGVNVALANCGNPGMASGGMGDVLSGMIGAFIAQGLDLATAARCAVLAHGTAADKAAAVRGERSLLAADLLEEIKLD
ncbi:NAD(P)HX epimerase [Halorhodospira halochloris]|uniref:Bifunctional NAD(P)H-hydrate repair enzyme n=1 Tax=Halorhodospira halochloris TaxID=1052 RepID=A0A110B547_HALHR|nr:NAD(P)H-hydrate dehydratase [Halorhodospira halochloris]MBK1651547.1 hypothetical protein [Halorhodospira halochloris]BAU57188.1 NAD(P)HX epimerase [Halorhodospira halochloris]